MAKETEIALGFASAIVVLLITLLLNNISERFKTRKAKRLQLRYEMFGNCHSIILNSIHASLWVLESKYRYSIYKVTNDEIEKDAYHRYVSEGEKFSIEASKELSQLISKLGLFEDCWDVPCEVTTIKNLILIMNKKPSPSMQFDGVFNDKMSESEIEKTYNFHKKSVREYVLKFTYAENLLKVMDILDTKLKRALFVDI